VTADPHAADLDAVPALVACDLDGTFLSPDGTVSETNARAVAAAQDAGIPVVFATGRPIRWLDVIADLPGAHPTVIASNGAVLYDLGARQALDRLCLNPDVALTAVARIRARVPDVAFAFESGTHFGYEPAYRTLVPDTGQDPTLRHGVVEELAREISAVKMLVQSRSLNDDALLVEVRACVGDTLTATCSSGRGEGLVELSSAGVDKASMLARTCARLGVPARRVAAFGDMPNDVSMLSWVGMPRVVANAHPALLALGFPVVPPNHESGVGSTILDWVSRAASRSADDSLSPSTGYAGAAAPA
jgi:Cof subfamily protein (haloacid dehalogenase superfamily)